MQPHHPESEVYREKERQEARGGWGREGVEGGKGEVGGGDVGEEEERDRMMVEEGLRDVFHMRARRRWRYEWQQWLMLKNKEGSLEVLLSDLNQEVNCLTRQREDQTSETSRLRSIIKTLEREARKARI